jgi:dienelactone hydrolase
MKRLLLLFFVVVVGCSGGKDSPEVPSADALTLKASDGVEVFAELVRSRTEPAKGVVLMFHQAGSNRHEYDPIAPRVAEWGWDCLKVDQRAGGDMWGHGNQTAAGLDKEADYEAAYADMEAALTWAEAKGYKRIVAWGSSYSASLVLKLASQSGSVDAVVSFSPGEYFGEEKTVANMNANVKVPCFFAATSEELIGGVFEIVDTKPQAAGRELDTVFGTKDGVHGSSALREDKNPKDYELYWDKLETFFRALESGGRNFGG